MLESRTGRVQGAKKFIFYQLRMKKHMSKFLTRTPRILAILFTIFISMFALDIFDAGFWFHYLRLRWAILLMLLIPSFILIALLIISWKHELVWAIAFTLAGLASYIVMVLMNFGLSRSLIIAWPAILIGILFRLSRRQKQNPNHKV